MRNMSFALTTEQILDRSKTVTRRMGWRNLRPGQEIRAVKKCMGLKPGETVQPLATLRVVSVRREPLNEMLSDTDYGSVECVNEGFPHLKPLGFVAMFCGTHKGCEYSTEVTRIEFEHVSANA